MLTPAEILKQYYGYNAFREGQRELIDAIVGGGDALGVMPTGSGKSLCYQIPALLLPGVTLVISPLISLMRDQVLALVANGIPAAFINSSLTEAQAARAMENARRGRYKIIYIAPERLLSPSMLALARSLYVSLLAIDEAHCISQWGQDFRPSYLDIPAFVAALPVRPVLAAFTATATPRVRDDIKVALSLHNPLVLVTGFDRPNLYFSIRTPRNKYAELVRYLRENDENGIVYCSTRKEVERVTEQLIADGYSAARYHAGLSEKERSTAQDDFLYDRVKIIVATNAFGMGIDKSNVRFVIHYNMPQNVESYYQEAGRAGRDGLPSDCILYYARRDISTMLFLINRSDNAEEIARNKKLLFLMEKYCETDGCLRRYMLHYFGEQTTGDCGNCCSCNESHALMDVTADAEKVLTHIQTLNEADHRLMFTHMANILLGRSEDFTTFPTFGLMKGSTRHYIRKLTDQLSAQGYITDNGRIGVTQQAREALSYGSLATVRVRAPEDAVDGNANKPRKQRAQKTGYQDTDGLLSRLKALRLEIARAENVPAFVIFSDATLVDLCRKRPRTPKEMLSVSGVGAVKLARHGEQFLAAIASGKTPPTSGEASPPAPKAAEKKPRSPKSAAAGTAVSMYRRVKIAEEPLRIDAVADNINAALSAAQGPHVTGEKLKKLLKEEHYLKTTGDGERPTGAGSEFGITIRKRQSAAGTAIECLFGPDAQRLCVDLVLDGLE